MQLTQSRTSMKHDCMVIFLSPSKDWASGDVSILGFIIKLKMLLTEGTLSRLEQDLQLTAGKLLKLVKRTAKVYPWCYTKQTG